MPVFENLQIISERPEPHEENESSWSDASDLEVTVSEFSEDDESIKSVVHSEFSKESLKPLTPPPPSPPPQKRKKKPRQFMTKSRAIAILNTQLQN